MAISSRLLFFPCVFIIHAGNVCEYTAMTYAVHGHASYLHYMLLVEYNVYHIHYLNIFSPFKNGQVIHHLTQSVFLKLDACPHLLILRITVQSFVKYKFNVVFSLFTLPKFQSLP